jgi:hypothetical protein
MALYEWIVWIRRYITKQSFFFRYYVLCRDGFQLRIRYVTIHSSQDSLDGRVVHFNTSYTKVEVIHYAPTEFSTCSTSV